MSESNTRIRPLPVADKNIFQTECLAMIDWLGTIEMPEERVGIREAAGNLGGILVGLLTESRAFFYVEESANVVDLCDYLRKTADNDFYACILDAIYDSACEARDSGADIDIEFR